VTPRNIIESYRRFWATCYLHLQCQSRNSKVELIAVCLFGILLNPDDGGSIFRKNVGKLLPYHTVPLLRRQFFYEWALGPHLCAVTDTNDLFANNLKMFIGNTQWNWLATDVSIKMSARLLVNTGSNGANRRLISFVSFNYLLWQMCTWFYVTLGPSMIALTS
jgi:hypothetical protein